MLYECYHMHKIDVILHVVCRNSKEKALHKRYSLSEIVCYIKLDQENGGKQEQIEPYNVLSSKTVFSVQVKIKKNAIQCKYLDCRKYYYFRITSKWNGS